jgi:hypothetical protein
LKVILYNMVLGNSYLISCRSLIHNQMLRTGIGSAMRNMQRNQR